ncbi:hypothetical protein [Pseudomonas juntendi]|uniref:Uncharacterized protein n=1 Tax=Pseudomonas juntendi TaxID=2666183 RepID=A0AAJ5RYT1_9PSED|nr:hypothetical protein [Pseudomonas juntendi]WEA18914.1 hypothetical protein PWA60_16595 [Pseudomonas juntendi]
MATSAGIQSDLPTINRDPRNDVDPPFTRAFIDHFLARLLAAFVNDALSVFS